MKRKRAYLATPQKTMMFTSRNPHQQTMQTLTPRRATCAHCETPPPAAYPTPVFSDGFLSIARRSISKYGLSRSGGWSHNEERRQPWGRNTMKAARCLPSRRCCGPYALAASFLVFMPNRRVSFSNLNPCGNIKKIEQNAFRTRTLFDFAQRAKLNFLNLRMQNAGVGSESERASFSVRLSMPFLLSSLSVSPGWCSVHSHSG